MAQANMIGKASYENRSIINCRCPFDLKIALKRGEEVPTADST